MLVLFIALIIGLVNPSLVLRWSKKPTRLKVFLWWLLANVLLSILLAIISPAISSKEILGSANQLIKEGNYSRALTELNKINKNDSLYVEAQQLINKADSLKSMEEKEKKIENKQEKKITEITNIQNSTVIDSVSQQKEQLEREINSIDKGIDFSKYHGANSVEELQIEIVLFGTWGKMIIEGEKSNNNELKQLCSKLKERVVKIQIKEFPLLRKQYAQIAKQKMWEHDIDVYASGKGYKCINFTGGIFAANKNKQDFQNQINEVLTIFRFSQSRYRWFKDEDEYTYWTIYKGEDSDLVIL